jgi:hypothetical protein
MKTPVCSTSASRADVSASHADLMISYFNSCGSFVKLLVGTVHGACFVSRSC